MTDIDSLVKRIDRFESRNAIIELGTRYAMAFDEHDMPALLSLFTEDAVFDSPSGVMKAHGKGAIEAMFINMLKIRGPAYHWTHDHIVEFDGDDPDRATGIVLSHAETSPDGQGSMAAMKYEDVYARVNGQWKYARRSIHFLYYTPISEYGQILNRKDRLVVGGKRLPADYPESLPSWQEFKKNHA